MTKYVFGGTKEKPTNKDDTEKTYKDFNRLEQQKAQEQKNKLNLVQKNDQLDLKPDLTLISDQKIYDQRRPDDHAGRPQVDHPLVDDHKKVVNHDKSHCPSRTDRDKVGLRLPKHKVSKYKMWAFQHKISLQDLVEIAVDRLLDDHTFVVDHASVDDHNGRPQHDRYQIDHDDIEDQSVDDHKLNETLNFYKEWTGNKITRNDEISYASIEKYQLIDIKIGILQAVKGSKKPIKKFSYCCTVIKNNAVHAGKTRYKRNKQQELKDLMYELEKK